jgi:RNA polymerase sigma-70 factor (ECF subfamily)
MKKDISGVHYEIFQESTMVESLIINDRNADLMDEDVFSKLVRQAHSKVYYIAKGILRSEADAEEAAQDAFLKAYRERAQFDHRSKPLAWLYIIARNAALDKRRRNKTSTTFYETEIDGSDAINARQLTVVPEQQAVVEDNERTVFVGRALSKLPDENRVALILRVYEGRSIQEIAQILGENETTVKYRIHHGKQKLRRRMSMPKIRGRGTPERPALPARSTSCPRIS